MNNALRFAAAALAFAALTSGAQAATGHAAMSVGVTVLATPCVASTVDANGNHDAMCAAAVVSHAVTIEAVNARAASMIAAGQQDVVEYAY